MTQPHGAFFLLISCRKKDEIGFSCSMSGMPRSILPVRRAYWPWINPFGWFPFESVEVLKAHSIRTPWNSLNFCVHSSSLELCSSTHTIFDEAEPSSLARSVCFLAEILTAQHLDWALYFTVAQTVSDRSHPPSLSAFDSFQWSRPRMKRDSWIGVWLLLKTFSI